MATSKAQSYVNVSLAVPEEVEEMLQGAMFGGVKKSQPGSSSVHVNKPIGEEEDLANEHARSVQPKSPPAPAKATRRSRQAIPPEITNLGPDVEKGSNNKIVGNAQMGDNAEVGLYDMQQIVQGTDWEISHGLEDENMARDMALENLENDPDYYRKKIIQQDLSEDPLTKDTNENEDASISDWPVGLDLDLCSGPTREPGYLGFDLYPHDHGTIIHDLTLGIPVPDECAKSVRLVNGLEYMEMEDPKPLLSEIQRVLMPGGQFLYEGPNEIYNYPDWLESYPGLVLETHEDNSDQHVEKVEGQPWVRQTFTRIAMPDAATANDSEPRIGIAQYDMLPADALLAMDALGYYWSDATSSGRGNRLHGYPSQGALVDRDEEEAANNAVSKDTEVLADELSTSKVIGYALPEERRYPIRNIEEAMKVLKDVSGRAEEENVKNAVYRKFPELRGEVLIRKDRISKMLEKSRTVEIKKFDKKKQIIYCVVLTPEELDSQDDWMTADDIEEAAHQYLTKSRVIGSDHEKPIDAEPVESYIAPQDLNWEDGPYGPQIVKKGAWVLGIKIHDPKEWEKVENGDYQGVSIGGVGLRS